ncbi:MAG TPA: XRE family transcriptional regulator [Thioploca sp.]|nr:MAG: transcriptional regulator [Gammaproteobacteria bacterium]HDN26994.1 XRE family transcriptional regulator [Thioploca sp.]
MNDLQKYISHRKQHDSEFAEGFDEGYQVFKLSAILRQTREASGLTQEDMAQELKTKKSVISMIEEHAEEMTLSTLENFAAVLGKRIEFSIR